ncbi:MAG: SAM-dependent chlorinase/fluorinase [Thermodesulfovibrionales bacterium]
MFHRLITLTTDFGYEDPFAGVMKGVIYTINPHAIIVDLTHSITPQNIQEAAFTIGMNYHYFPKDSVHLVVVDPEVGSGRRPLLMVADEHYFIGPDNGVFSYLYKHAAKDLKVIHITSEHLFLRKDSPTFQGRDVFSPCAARLTSGLDVNEFGEEVSDYHAIDLPSPVRGNDLVLQGEVIFTDRFGNAVTNINKDDMVDLQGMRPGVALRIFFKGRDMRLRSYYCQAENMEISALINSSGYLEIFIFRDSAASKYDILPGDVVKVVFSS